MIAPPFCGHAVSTDNADYRRGYYDGIDDALNLINATEATTAKEYRKKLYHALMEKRPK